jgi:hypothetical protein
MEIRKFGAVAGTLIFLRSHHEYQGF